MPSREEDIERLLYLDKQIICAVVHDGSGRFDLRFVLGPVACATSSGSSDRSRPPCADSNTPKTALGRASLRGDGAIAKLYDSCSVVKLVKAGGRAIRLYYALFYAMKLLKVGEADAFS